MEPADVAKQSETMKEEEPSSCKVLPGEGNDEVCAKHKTTEVTLVWFQNYTWKNISLDIRVFFVPQSTNVC